MLKTISYATIIILFLLAGSAFAFQTVNQADDTSPMITPASEAATTPLIEADDVALIWEGDPLPDDNQEECRRLQLTVDGRAMIGPCGAAEISVELMAGQPGGWNDMALRFSPFTTTTVQGQIDFRGQGQISSLAWQRAITTWAWFTYNELASGRVSASARTVLSWWLGEIPAQPGSCRHLVVLSHGYAYSNITPCEGGEVQDSVGGWLDTAEWDKFDPWLYTDAPVYQENNYLDGRGSIEMSEAEIANLADWAADVYLRLRNEVAVPEAGCPEATADTQLLQNSEHGYCLLYPARYTVEKPNDNETVLVVGSLLNVEDPRLHIEVSEAAGRSVAEVADQLEADYAVPGVEIKRSTATVAGEEAIVLDNVPGQDINRRVVFVHEGRLYSLMFAPASPDAGPTYERMEELYDLALNSFTFNAAR